MIRLVYVWLICRIDKRFVEKATGLSKGLRAVLVKRGIPLREWVELGGARERQRRADWVPPSKRVEYYVGAVIARLGLGGQRWRRLWRSIGAGEGGACGEVAEGGRAAVIYAATCTPTAEALGVSSITVRETVHKLRLTTKMCIRRSVPERGVMST